MILAAITVDTEPDNVWSNFRSSGLDNIRALERFHELMVEWGIPPTYLITHSVASDPTAVSRLQRFARKGPLEVGAHLHAWETPPYLRDGSDRQYPVFAHDLQPELVHEKLQTLTQRIAENFDEPTSYRAGRFGFVREHIRILESLGYSVDSSITPLEDRSEKFGLPPALGGRGGRDYRRAPLEPYHPAYEDDLIPGSSQLLEVPVTVGPTRSWPGLLPFHRYGPEVLQRVLRKARVSEVVLASPPQYGWPQLDRLLTTCLHSERTVLNFMLHSSEVMAGGAPWIQDDAALEALYDRLRRCIVWLRERAQVRFASLAQIPGIFTRPGSQSAC
ncbi:MAG: hypothetical protein Q7W02_28965 [Candidatus Rokubacteria bacterium]|nr:hypothetical protein [Candidatus Rokubacteria bacterium]